MRCAKRISFFFLILLFIGAKPAYSLEIPELTWERGKTLNVVLGGNSENLGWDIYLENDQVEPLMFSRSLGNSSDFFVYSISLPRDLPTGQYELIARDNSLDSTLLAAVQVVERFQYNIMEIPRDLLFLITCLAFFLAMQVTVRTWFRRDASFGDWSIEALSLNDSKSGLMRALFLQRIRWRESWVGKDFLPSGSSSLNWKWLSTLPLVSLVLSLYLGFTRVWEDVLNQESIFIFLVLSAIGVVDRYSAKIAGIGLFSVFIIFNSSLNLPSIISFVFIISMLFLPQYVGDLIKAFTSYVGLDKKIRKELSQGFAALGAGISIFWLYILAESVTFGGKTDASGMTLVASVTSASYLWRNIAISKSSNAAIGSTHVNEELQPVIPLRTAIFLLLVGCATIFIWTSNSKVSTVASLALFAGLISINLEPKQRIQIKSKFLGSEYLHFLLCLIVGTSSTFLILRSPLITADRSEFILLAVSLPILIFSITRFLFEPSRLVRLPNRNLSDQLSSRGESI